MKRERQLTYQSTDKGKETRRRWYWAHREERQEKRKEYVSTRREYLNTQKREHYRKNRDKILARDRARQKEKHLRTRYGLSQQKFDAMLKAQNHSCAICREFFGSKRISVDHCHKTGYVRALLCNNCNSAIGFMKNSQGIAIAAAHYLSKEVLFNGQV